MGHFHIELDLALGRMLEVYMAVNKKPREYHPGIILYLSEIHMIEAIGLYPNSKLMDIANVLNITKGTVSKLITKLVGKDLVSKYQVEGNKKEVYFRLTEQGQAAFDGHYALHRAKSADIDKKLDEYSLEEQEIILDFVKIYTEELSRYVD